MLSSNETLAGLVPVVVLAMGCRLLARRLRLPVIVVLLPVGFAAGAATNDVHPNDLLGGVYQPFVSVAVGLILFEAGLRLRLGELAGGDRRVVRTLLRIGRPVTAVHGRPTSCAGGVSRRRNRSTKDSIGRRSLVMKGSPVRVRASALGKGLQMSVFAVELLVASTDPPTYSPTSDIGHLKPEARADGAAVRPTMGPLATYSPAHGVGK